MRDKYNKLYKKCSDFFGRVNYKSTLKIVLFVFPIIFVLQLILTSGSNNYQKNVKSQQAIQLSKLNSLVSPSEMIPGIINSDTRYLINSTADYAEEISSENNKLLCPAGLSVSIRYSYGCFVTKSNLKTIEKNLQEYSTTLDAVLDFMEYNPEVDFTNYSPGATNTTDRINFLKEGVASTIDNINKLGFNNEYTESMKVLVVDSQNAIEELEKTDEVSAFSTKIISNQEEIKGILESYYSEVTNISRQASIDILRRFN